MVNRESLRMKLKERVIFVLLLSICVLFIVKLKLTNYQQNKLTGNDGDSEFEDEKYGLDHSHRKRESLLGDSKEPKSHENLLTVKENKDSLETNGQSHEIIENNEQEKTEEKHTNIEKDETNQMDPWDMWWTMVNERHVTAPNAEKKIERILQALATRKITTAKAFTRGTQLKVLLKLDGSSEQKVVFKPMR